MSVNRKRAARRRRKQRKREKYEESLAYARGLTEPRRNVWAVPKGVTSVHVMAVGGGGGGGRGPVQKPQLIEELEDFMATFGTPVSAKVLPVTPGQEYEITVGAGGGGGP